MTLDERGNYFVDNILGRKAQADMVKAVAQLRTDLIKHNDDRDNYDFDDIRYWGYTACPECGGSKFDFQTDSIAFGDGDGVTFFYVKCKDCSWSDEEEH